MLNENNKYDAGKKHAIHIPPIASDRNTDVCAVSGPPIEPLLNVLDLLAMGSPSGQQHLTSPGPIQSTLIRCGVNSEAGVLLPQHHNEFVLLRRNLLPTAGFFGLRCGVL